MSTDLKRFAKQEDDIRESGLKKDYNYLMERKQREFKAMFDIPGIVDSKTFDTN
jgi:hypothetical protein